MKLLNQIIFVKTVSVEATWIRTFSGCPFEVEAMAIDENIPKDKTEEVKSIPNFFNLAKIILLKSIELCEFISNL